MRLSSLFVFHRACHSAWVAPVLACTLLVASACAPKKTETSNADMANQYSGDKYEKDVVSTKTYQSHDEQGSAVSMGAIHAIQDGIERVYSEDFNHCMEEEMERLGNMNVGGTFAFEITVETSGKVSKVKFTAVDVRERKPAPKRKDMREADQFSACLEAKMLKDWEFSPAPETQYRHTYAGKAGAAW